MAERPDERNRKLTGSRLTMTDFYTCERRTVLDGFGDDGDIEIWDQGGSIEPREPTVVEVQAWLAKKLAGSAPPEDADG